MFSFESNASKFGFTILVKKLEARGFTLIDCQQETAHLGSLGARAIPREDFLKKLRANAREQDFLGNWGQLLD